MTTTYEVDVAIVGAGPSGAALAAALSPLWRVALVDRDRVPSRRIGESLIPAAERVLRTIGLSSGIDELNFPPYLGNRAWWNGRCETTDFLADPLGPGRHLDRRLFDAYLRERAEERGALCLFGVDWHLDPHGGPDLHRLTVAPRNDPPRVILTRFVVDATGRRAGIARSLGARRTSIDRQVARWTTWTTPADVHGEGPVSIGFSHVESEPDGWWYHAQIPDHSGVVTTVLAFHHDRGAQSRHSADEVRVAASQLPGLGAFVPVVRPADQRKAVTVAANSSRLDRCAGSNWIAVGDAALSFDPLASRGLFNALSTALTAAAVLDATLQSGKSCLDEYEGELESVWQTYLAHRSWIYRSEQRWPNRPYWRDRGAGRSPLS